MHLIRSRLAISMFFFFHGLCFSSWGARIPAIQDIHGLSEISLGTMLLTLPIGSVLSMPLAAAVVSKFGSKRILLLSNILYASLLVFVGLAQTVWQLSVCLIIFGLTSNMVNVSLNTQAVKLESLFLRPIMASLHGLWSLAGFVGGAIGGIMIGAGIVPYQHFSLILIFVVLMALYSSRSLITEEPGKRVIGEARFTWPDRSLFGLGVLAFLSMICEGAMFDWSGIYFKKVIGAQGAWVSAGYVSFMSTMAGARFVADYFKERYGFKVVLQVSGILIFTGLIIAVVFPLLYPAMIGFLLVGVGVSAVVPLVFSEAGKTRIMSPSSAIAAVSTIGFLGFLIGPPLIGWVAGASSLRFSIVIIAFMGLCIAILSKTLKV